MNRLEALLQVVQIELATLEHAWALVGGLAVSVRAEPRFTRDIDLVIALDNDKQAEALILNLQSRNFVVLATVEQEATGRLATVRLYPSGTSPDGVVLDLLFGSSGIEAEIVAAAEVIDILPNLSVPVAKTGHLIALKLLARDDTDRPQDIADLRALLSVADASELERAREAIRLIRARGYHRNRPLEQHLEQLRQQYT